MRPRNHSNAERASSSQRGVLGGADTPRGRPTTVACASIGCWSNRAGSSPLAVEAVAADRPEVPLRGASGPRPASAERLQADLQRRGVAAVAAAGDQGVRQPGVVVASAISSNHGQSSASPFGRTGRPAGPSACRGPGRRAGRRSNRRRYSWMPSRPKAQARGEVVSRHGRQGQLEVARRPRTGRSGRRDRPTHVPSAQMARPMAIVRPDLLQPAAVEAHEVAEPPRARGRRRAWRNAA